MPTTKVYTTVLTRLKIRNFLHLSALDMEWSGGLSVLTGPSGAGKSLFIKAFQWLSGTKLNSVRLAAAAPCEVEAEFRVSSDHVVWQKLLGVGISPLISEGISLLRVRRVMHTKSLQYVQEQSVSLKLLAEICRELVEVVNQHAHLQWLDPGTHHGLLMAHFADPGHTKQSYTVAYSCMHELWQKFRQDSDRYHSLCLEKTQWTERIRDLELLSPMEEDFHNLQAYVKDSAQWQQRRQFLSELSLLWEGATDPDSSSVLRQRLQQCKRFVQKAPFAEYEVLGEHLEACLKSYEELSFTLASYLHGLEFNQEVYEAKQKRLGAYHSAMRRYHVATPLDLQRLYQEACHQRTWVEGFLKQLTPRLRQLHEAALSLQEASTALVGAQKAHAEEFLEQLNDDLVGLSVRGSLIAQWHSCTNAPKVAVDGLGDWTPKEVSLWEQIQVVWQGLTPQGPVVATLHLSYPDDHSPEPGAVSSRALSTMASGGELSRVMLALKLNQIKPGCLLILDEIDAGLSGQIADRVGARLRRLAKTRQVVCVSHLAQVAVYAEGHYGIDSSGMLTRLSPQARLHAIAGLLSGQTLTPASLANAQTLIERRQSV